MASTDWTVLNDSLDASTVDRGATTGIARPAGGGSFVYGFNSLATTEGAVGLFTNQVDFAPMAKGGSIRGAIQRGPSGGKLNFAPMLFLCLQGPSVEDEGYILGLGDGDPHHIVLRKGTLLSGLPDVVPDPTGVQGVLARSTVTYAAGTWLHLRLDAIVNLNGDVILQAFQSDLAAHNVDAPSWVAIPGLDEFIDDTLQVNSGSAAFTSGRAGFGMYTKDVTRRAYFDQIEISRQL